MRRNRTMIKLAAATAFSVLAAESLSTTLHAATPSQKQALAACRAQFGKKVEQAVINKNGTFRCYWHTYAKREMTRDEAYEACRKQYGATTVFLTKRKNGWWCRYKPYH